MNICFRPFSKVFPVSPGNLVFWSIHPNGIFWQFPSDWQLSCISNIEIFFNREWQNHPYHLTLPGCIHFWIGLLGWYLSLTTPGAPDSPVCCCLEYFVLQENCFLFMPLLIDRGYIGFFFSRLSVCLPQKTFTVSITWMISEKSFYILLCLVLVVRPFLWYQGQGHLSRSNIKITLKKNGCSRGLSVSNILLVSIFVCVCSMC